MTSVISTVMKRNYQDFSGQKIGYLTIIRRVPAPVGYRSGVIYWSAICDCGKEKITTSWAIRESSIPLSCGCKKYYHGQPKNRKHTNPQDATWNAIINSYKQRCRRDQIEWTLKREFAITLFTSKCHYCGIEPFVKKNVYKTKQRLQHESSSLQEWREEAEVSYNGIDRLDSNAHYTHDNVVACCKICNYAKRDLTAQEFIEWIQRIRTNG